MLKKGSADLSWQLIALIVLGLAVVVVLVIVWKGWFFKDGGFLGGLFGAGKDSLQQVAP